MPSSGAGAAAMPAAAGRAGFRKASSKKRLPAVAAVDCADDQGLVGDHEEHEAAVRDHEVKRQCQHAQHIVKVEPGTVALAGTEGEEIPEDAPMRNDAGDDRHQHEHRADADDPVAHLPRQVVQDVVHLVEHGAAAGVPCLERPAACVVEHAGAALGGAGRFRRRAAPEHADLLDVVAVRRVDRPALGVGRDFAQIVETEGQTFRLRDRLGIERHLGTHPAVDFGVEVTDRPGQKHEVQQPAREEAGPGMQPGHRLPESALHATAPLVASATMPNTAVHAPIPIQARSAERVANAQSTARQ